MARSPAHPATLLLMHAPTNPPMQGAIYLDGDLEAVRRCYTGHFPLPADPLSLLQPDGTGGIPAASSSSPAANSPWE